MILRHFLANQLKHINRTTINVNGRTKNSSAALSYVHFNDVSIPLGKGSNSEKVPIDYQFPIETNFINQHLRWIGQKDLMGQDIFLLGWPGPLRRRIAMCYAELTHREVEYLVVTRDTTESDIKQRREIEDGKTVYVDQAAVKAALNGRLLVIDGVEKAERNILPILNNLLENREMQLDDGRFLMAPSRYDSLREVFSQEEMKDKKLERVDENFRVIALGLPVPAFKGNPLDPPIRSRFQARQITALPFEDMLQMISTLPKVTSTDISAAITYGQVINSPELSSLSVPKFPEMSLVDMASGNEKVLDTSVNKLTKVLSWMYPHHVFSREVGKKVDEIRQNCGIEKSEPVLGSKIPNEFTKTVTDESTDDSFYVSNKSHDYLLTEMVESYNLGADLCLIGDRSSGKSTVSKKFANLIRNKSEAFMMYSDITARDLLQQRSTKPNGNTFWNNSPLIDAALGGKLAILDGLHCVAQDTLPAIQSLIHDRDVTLFDGTRLISQIKFEKMQLRTEKDSKQLNALGVFPIPRTFRLLALAETPSSTNHWLNSEVLSMFHFHTVQPIQLQEQIMLFAQLFPNVEQSVISQICTFSHSLRSSQDENLQALANSLSLKQIKRILKTVQADSSCNISQCLEKCFMPQFLPALPKQAFYDFFHQHFQSSGEYRKGNVKKHNGQIDMYSNFNSRNNMNADGAVNTNVDATLIPETLFYENEEQSSILSDMIRSFSLDEHLLLVGNQGVGKNKLTDHMLKTMSQPRQYIQLHRDTTVQSLTVQPAIKDGKIVYEDSPLIKAVKNGHVLVIDEADKAPTHVTSVLKSLIEEKSMFLSDGRKIVDSTKQNLSYSAKSDFIPCHPDFRIIVLANRPGFPFLGNNFFASMGDLFSCHAIQNPDKMSQLQMLANYAPNVPRDIIEKLVNAFDELREFSSKGSLSYPYSTRELVNIVKHLERFPKDGVARALSNVFDFDKFDENSLQEVHNILKRNGIPVQSGSAEVHLAKVTPLPKLKLLGTLDSYVADQMDVKFDRSNLNMENFSVLECKPHFLKMQTFSPRSEFFQEQSKVWSLPIELTTSVSDIAVKNISEEDDNAANRSSYLLAVTCNPVKLYGFSVFSNGVNSVTDLCSCFDLSDMVSGYNYNVAMQLNFFNSQKLFEGRGAAAVYSVTNKTLVLFEPMSGRMKKMDMSRFFESSESLSSYSSVFKRSKTGNTAMFKMLKNEFESSCLVFYDSKLSNIYVLDLDCDKVLHYKLPFSMKSIQLVSNKEIVLFGEKESIYKITINSEAEPENGNVFVQSYINTFKDGIIATSALTFDSNLISDLLSNGKVSEPSKLVTGNRTMIGASIGFPELDEGKVYGIRRDSTVKGDLYSTFLGASFAAVTLVDTRMVGKDKLPDGLDITKNSLCLEWINIRSKAIRYLPVPQNKHQHPMVYNMSPMYHYNLVLASDCDSYVYTCDPWGTIRQWEVNYELLKSSYVEWVSMIGQPDEPIKIRHSSREASGPKHGKFDPTGNPHVGGNTWAGGSGGADTAGLGGVGGPYRLDLGHEVFQVPDEMKQNVPPHVLKAAKEMRDKAFKDRLKEIKMSEFEADIYNSFYDSVKSHINSVRVVIESLEAKQKDREWLKHQTVGEFDDTKIVDSILGEKSVFKRRGEKEKLPGEVLTKPKHLRLLVDVSGSMYRFNGYDRRLQRQLESVCMVMEALKGYESKFKLDIYGHSGESDCVELVSLDKAPPSNEKERLQVLQTMHAHSQFCLSGDSTVEACLKSVKQLATLDADERFLIMFSDANFSRYGISPKKLAEAMLSENATVNSFVVFIGSLGDQARLMQSQLPSQTSFVCMDTKQIPNVLRQILTSTMLK